MLLGFLLLYQWHLSIIDNASTHKMTPYAPVHAVTRLLSSPSWDSIAVPVNLFFDFGIWPGAVMAFIVAIVWRSDTALQTSGPVIFALIYVVMTSHGYGTAWLALLNDVVVTIMVFAIATIPFTLAGRKLRFRFDLKMTNQSDNGD